MDAARREFLAIACVLLAGCTASPPRALRARSEPPLQINEPEESDDSLVAAHNRIRAQRGLPPLAPNAELTAAANRHARDMATRGRMRHRGSDGTSPFQRMTQEGYTFRSAAENIAYGQPNVESVIDAWWRSPPHRANLLGNFSEIGTGTAIDEDGNRYWCVTFGKPSSG